MKGKQTTVSNSTMILDSNKKNKTLTDLAALIARHKDEIIRQNKIDLDSAAHLDPTLIDRLKVDEKKVKGMVAAVEEVISLEDPEGKVLSQYQHPNGIFVENRIVPFGRILIIYESRPDVTIEAAIKKAHEFFPSVPVFASGKSFGGRMSSQYLAAQPAVDVKGIIFFGFPLHPSGKPSIERADHLKSVNVPMLFLQGSRDELATYELIMKVCASLPLATLVKIEGANHAFKAGKLDVMSILTDATSSWVEEKLKA